MSPKTLLTGSDNNNTCKTIILPGQRVVVMTARRGPRSDHCVRLLLLLRAVKLLLQQQLLLLLLRLLLLLLLVMVMSAAVVRIIAVHRRRRLGVDGRRRRFRTVLFRASMPWHGASTCRRCSTVAAAERRHSHACWNIKLLLPSFHRIIIIVVRKIIIYDNYFFFLHFCKQSFPPPLIKIRRSYYD